MLGTRNVEGLSDAKFVELQIYIRSMSSQKAPNENGAPRASPCHVCGICLDDVSAAGRGVEFRATLLAPVTSCIFGAWPNSAHKRMQTASCDARPAAG